jgi:hypothetical protein
MPLQLLKAAPDVCLDVFHHVAKVNRTIGIRQGAGDQNFAARAAHRKNTVMSVKLAAHYFTNHLKRRRQSVKT